ncbi:thiolase family protein [Virgibacillus sp. NKC19-16]|uniref:thiolase family protein n=1 Tax=Virgibacillus salidurans TaxID=2831673 RepID=UPI001F21F5C0|nr:thiolase family protein [Virgibacillus sp. NKC19-16]UJL45487.1 thiolase family protein [Virgibacillus sp. NKC19-16]
MTQAYIIDSVRTAIGKMGGTLKDVPPDFLAAHVIEEIVKRTSAEKKEIDEVIMGHTKQSADTPNIARLSLLRANLPVETPGYTVQRQCGSSLQAINNAALQISGGAAEVVIAGGVESMSTAPFYMRNARYGVGTGNRQLLDSNTESQFRSQPYEEYGDLSMGLTAENLVDKYTISRSEQDEFALRSQELAEDAISSGKFEKEIIPYEVKHRKSTDFFKIDEHPRVTSLEKLGKLKSVFKKDGTVTAGNSSGRNDGASAVMMMSEHQVEKYSLKPKAKILSQAVSGVSPEIMGIGPVKATYQALKRANLSLDDLGLIELNEAFSAQALAVIEELGLDLNKVNVNGGAIALGHPLGATGAILMTKLLHEMERREEKYGLVTLCIGGGQGISTIVENCQL